jgi:glycosyltransferase involved in cell wall biosynthesis
MKKKKILFHSNHSRAFTGFGKNCKNTLSYLFSTGKYEIIEACNGMTKSNPHLSKMPWKCVGTLPDDHVRLQQINKDPNMARSAGYGSETIDDLIKEFKPDIYIGAEDIWGFNGYWKRKWWNKTNCMIWTTIDSEPILPLALEAAPLVKNFYVWASFAERELHKLGHTNVKTLRGTVKTDNFFRLPDDSRSKLRKKFSIEQDCFVIGFVFRNQLRKSVPNLLDGFLDFQKNNPKVNTKLLLHTHWGEGWDIVRLTKEKNIPLSSILTTYYCKKCKQYQIKPFEGQEKTCPFCKTEKSQNTTNVQSGVSEEQLNEIYNLMDVYCHPFTSGGQEIPIQEAKLTELITLVTNYSCGEDTSTSESGSFPLDWAEYREPGTQFIKASTYPSSISKQLNKVYKMNKSKVSSMGKRGRQFVIDNFSTEVIGKKLEDIFDSMDFCEWDFDFSEKPRNPNYNPPHFDNDSEWLIDLYKNILNMEVDPAGDKGHAYWTEQINKGFPKDEVLKYFKKVASDENSKIDNSYEFEDFLSDEGPERRIAVVMPESAGDVLMMNSLMENLKKLYPDHNIYFITKKQFFPLIEDNPHIFKTINYQKEFDNLLALEGRGNFKGYFDVAYLPHVGTQKILTYVHNGKDKLGIELYEN